MRWHSRGVATTTMTLVTFAVLAAMVLSSMESAIRNSYAVAIGPTWPSWIQPGEYIEYDQTYTIAGLTASILLKDTFLEAGGATVDREWFDPHLSAGFAMPGLVAPYNASSVEDLTMFVDQNELAYTNASVVPLRLLGSGGPVVQTWKVDEVALYNYIDVQPGSSEAIVNSSFVWFQKDTLVKVRESSNYTDLVHDHYIISVATLEDTNIPQLKSLLLSAQSNSTLTTTPVSPVSSVASPGVQSPISEFGWAVLFALGALGVVLIIATVFYLVRVKPRGSLGATPRQNADFLNVSMNGRPREAR